MVAVVVRPDRGGAGAISAFTLIELMIVIAIIAIIAAIAIPNLLESRITAAESSAASSLRSGVFPGQETYRTAGHNDLDDDNKGEYGHLCHLSGSRSTWGQAGGANALGPGFIELLSTEWDSRDVARLVPSSTLQDVNGYVFAMVLDADSGLDPAADADAARQINNAETYYASCAVPVAYNDTGRRSFVLTNVGLILTAPGSDVFESSPQAVFDAAVNGVGCFDTVASAVTRESREPRWNTQ